MLSRYSIHNNSKSKIVSSFGSVSSQFIKRVPPPRFLTTSVLSMCPLDWDCRYEQSFYVKSIPRKVCLCSFEVLHIFYTKGRTIRNLWVSHVTHVYGTSIVVMGFTNCKCITIFYKYIEGVFRGRTLKITF